VNAVALRWLGIPARDYQAMVGLLRDVMELRVELEEPGTTELSLPDGDRVQVFAPDHRYFGLFDRPVAMFEVDAVRGASTVRDGFSKPHLVGQSFFASQSKTSLRRVDPRAA